MNKTIINPENNFDSGFTLIEMLLAFALISLVITALCSFYLSGLQSWHRSIDRMEHQQTARIAMNKMISELQYAHLVKCSMDDNSAGTDLPSDIIYFRIYINGVSARHSFRLEGTQLHFDRRRDSTNTVRYTNVVALGLSALEFLIDDTDTVYITVKAGEGSAEVTLTGAIKPRNIYQAPMEQDSSLTGEDVDED